MSDQTLGERLAEKIVRMTGQHYFGSLIGGMSGLASLIDSDEGVKRLIVEKDAHAKTAKQFVDMKACADSLELKIGRLVADKERELRDAWEAGIKLARSYHDNIIFLEGEQKEWQWQKFRAASLQPVDKTGTSAGLEEKPLDGVVSGSFDCGFCNGRHELVRELEYLRSEGSVTVPRLQRRFRFGFHHALSVFQAMQTRGFISPSGVSLLRPSAQPTKPEEGERFWAVCRLCGQEIKNQQAGTNIRVSDGTTAAVHRSCANDL